MYLFLIACMGCGEGDLYSTTYVNAEDITFDVSTTVEVSQQEDMNVCQQTFGLDKVEQLSVENIWTKDQLALLPLGTQGVVRTVLHGFDLTDLPVTLAGYAGSILPDSTTPILLFHGVAADECSENMWDKWHGAVHGMSGSPVIIQDRIAAALSYGLSGPEVSEPYQFGATPAHMMAEIGGEVGASKPGSSQDGGGMQTMGMMSINVGPRYIKMYEEVMASKGITPSLQLFSTSGDGGGTGHVFEKGTIPEMVPGSGIAIPFIMPEGDEGILSMAGVGTVTMIKGDRLWAFGHPLGMAGEISLPYTAAWIDSTVGDYFTAFKLGIPAGPVLGSVVVDRSVAIVGVKGLIPTMIRTIGTVRYGEKVKIFRHMLADTSKLLSLTPLDFLVALATITPVDVVVDQIGVESTVVATVTVAIRGSTIPAKFRIVRSNYDSVGMLMWDILTNLSDLTKAFGEVVIEQVESDVKYEEGLRVVRLDYLELQEEELLPGEKLTAILHYHTEGKWKPQEHEFTFVLPNDFTPGANITISIGGGNGSMYSSGDEPSYEVGEDCNPIYPESVVEWVTHFNSSRKTQDTVKVVVETTNTGLDDCLKVCEEEEVEVGDDKDPAPIPEPEPKGSGAGEPPPVEPGPVGDTPCQKACNEKFECAKPFTVLSTWTVPEYEIYGSVSGSIQIKEEKLEPPKAP